MPKKIQTLPEIPQMNDARQEKEKEREYLQRTHERLDFYSFLRTNLTVISLDDDDEDDDELG